MRMPRVGRGLTFWRCAMTLAVLLGWTGLAHGYLVGPAVSLDKLTEEADIVFKGTAVASQPAQDNWFKAYPGFGANETQFHIISVIKGPATGDQLAFRHYDQASQLGGRVFEPQYYHFEVGRTYLVFAKSSGAAGVWRQLWPDQKNKPDQGVVLCGDAKPVVANTVKAALWHELTAMLTSPRASDALDAIGQLDQMSAGRLTFDNLTDFDRGDVLAAIHGLLLNPDPQIAQAAIRLIGSRNPYLSDDQAQFWLATVGSAEVPGIGKMNPNLKNVGGELYWKDLVALADQSPDNGTRALAIRALGLVREPALQDCILRWMAQPDPGVRAAALLLADFPSAETRQRLTTLSTDAAPQVRANVARAVGYAQQTALIDVLRTLMADQAAPVREAAAMSLLSFSPRLPNVAAVFRANLDNTEFKPLFLIALAREDPALYLDALSTAVEQKTEPPHFWGGQIPAFTAWEILFKYLQARPVEEIRAGHFDRYLRAMEQVGNYSSAEPRDIYAFYVQRGMTEQAQRFRAAAKKAYGYDLDYYFKQVDENPALYKRE